MPGPERYPAAKRAEAERLIRETDAAYEAIAAQTGVAYSTICRWNRFAGYRPVTLRASRQRGLSPAIDAVRRGVRQPDVLVDALSMHVAREVAALDLALRRRKGETDSPRLLRDLAALAKILGDLNARQVSQREARRERDETSSDYATDITAAREELARRIESALGSGWPWPGAGRPAGSTAANEAE